MTFLLPIIWLVNNLKIKGNTILSRNVSIKLNYHFSTKISKQKILVFFFELVCISKSSLC